MRKRKAKDSVLTEAIRNVIPYGAASDIADKFEFIEQHPVLTYFEGIKSLVHKEGSKLVGFVFSKETVLDGYLSGNHFKRLDLTTGKKKIVKSITSSYYHFLLEDCSDIINIINDEKYSGMELIIDVSGVFEIIDDKSADFIKFFLQTLNDKNVPHKIVNFAHFDVVNIDHFYLLKPQYSPYAAMQGLYEHFKDYVVDKNVVPNKKVFLSRRKFDENPYAYYKDSYGVEKTFLRKRIDDEEELEKFFASRGFEIVYPEDFEDYEEQINFFYSVKTVASLTSSGLSSAALMQPGGNLVEVVTPLVAAPTSDDGTVGLLNRELHNYYKTVALLKSHLYIGLPNPYCKMDDLKIFAENSATLDKILKEL